MSETATTQRVPAWDLADRMRKSLREADIGVQEMADYLGVARNTVSTWINGRITPGKPILRLWALRCGVPYEWLNPGDAALVKDAQNRRGLWTVTPRIDRKDRPERRLAPRTIPALPRPVLADLLVA